MKAWVFALLVACTSSDFSNDVGESTHPPGGAADGGQSHPDATLPTPDASSPDSASADASPVPSPDAPIVAWNPVPLLFDVTWVCVKDCGCPPDLLDTQGIDYLRADCNPPGIRFSPSTTVCPKADAYVAQRDVTDPFVWTFPEFGGVNDCPTGPEPFGLKRAPSRQVDNDTLIGEITQFGYTKCKKDVDAAHSCLPTMKFTAKARK